MPELNLHFSSDEMTAYLSVSSIESSGPSLSILRTLLKRNHVVFGVDEKILAKIVDGSLKGKNIVIAQGRVAVPSKNGCLRWYVGDSGYGIHQPIKLVTSKMCDALFEVHKGDKIVKIEPAVNGTEGVTVTGKQIPVAVVSQIDIIAGTGTALENNSIIALKDGVVKHQGNTVEICEIMDIQGDVTTLKGTVNFTGAVKVNGSLRSGCKIVASEDIYITNDVEDAEISGGGSVYIAGNTRGTGRGTVECRNSLFCNEVESFTLRAGKNIAVAGNVINSTIVADGDVVVRNVAGGTITASSIQAASAGTVDNVRTVLDITRVRQLLQERYDMLKQYGNVTTEKASILNDVYTYVKRQMGVDGYLDREDEQVLNEMKQKAKIRIKAAGAIQKRLAYLEELENDGKGQSFIKAEALYPGTILKTVKEERLVEHEERNVDYYA